jgi:nitroimidazol reductase NimA-like FMN-containing flavoprotein (pyridoxamine 5'-phosphate oxidase superfamily)
MILMMEWVDEGLEILTEEECRALLATATVGRVAITVGALPVVLPVNFGLLDGDVVFVTGDGIKLRAAVDNTVVGFEVDEIDALAESGWSVMAVGNARLVTDTDEIARIRATGVRPWVRGGRDSWVRIWVSFLSGRRISPAVVENAG